MDIKLKLLKDWSYGDAEHKAGDHILIDQKAFADKLVEDGTAEIVKEKKEEKPKVTKAVAAQVEPTFSQEDLDTIIKSTVSELVKESRDGKSPVDAKVVGENVEDDPKRGFKTPRHLLNAVIDAEGKPFSKMAPGLPGMFRDKNGLAAKTAGSDEAMGISDPYGGFLIPTVLMPGVKMIGFEGDPTAGLTANMPMNNPTVPFNARVDKDHSTSVSGGLQVSRSVETATKSATRTKFEQIILKANSLFGVSYASEEILVDSPESFAAIIERGFQDEFGATILREKLRGSGVGEYEGVLSTPSLIAVDKEAEQAADTIVYENLINMRARCWGYGKAIWLANHDTLPQLMTIKQDIGTAGTAMWQMSALPDHPDTLFGRPLFMTEFASTLGDVGDLLLANWGEYLEGTYQSLQGAESMHVRFLNHERTFKFWTRNDARPWWRVALTPAESTTTLSPFVTIAERT